jgi:hypothetical protein
MCSTTKESFGLKKTTFVVVGLLFVLLLQTSIVESEIAPTLKVVAQNKQPLSDNKQIDTKVLNKKDLGLEGFNFYFYF